jgi:cell division septation protein DedD
VNPARTTATLLTAILLAVPLAGCGKDKPKIPRSDARSLVALLGTVKRQTDARACRTVETTIESLERRTEALPSNTDEDIRSSLRDGIANLRELVADECSGVKQKPETTSSESTTSEPSTTSDTSTDTNTDTTTETTTETSPTTSPDTTPNTTPRDGNTTPEPPSGGASAPGQLKKNKKGRAK